MSETVIQTKPFASRMSEVFKKAGQSAGDFLAELRALSLEDRRWYAAELNKAGYPTDPPKES